MSRFGNIADLAHDPVRSVHGIPIDFGAGRIITVRRAGGQNRLWGYEVARLLAQQRDEVFDGRLPPDVADEIEREAIATACVASWEGWVDTDGDDVACGLDTILELFDAVPDVFERVRAQALNGEAYRLRPADTKSAD